LFLIFGHCISLHLTSHKFKVEMRDELQGLN
jgi:hypothetical protein